MLFNGWFCQGCGQLIYGQQVHQCPGRTANHSFYGWSYTTGTKQPKYCDQCGKELKHK